MQLEKAACRLLQDDELVDCFNETAKLLDEVVTRLPNFGLRDAVKQIRDVDLPALATTLQSPRWRIGFIGPSQAGKSTTVANLLDVAKTDSPTPSGGAGGAMTAACTRLLPTAPSQGGPAVYLDYRTREDYEHRVRPIATLLEVSFDGDERKLLGLLQQQERDRPTFQAADRRVLVDLLNAGMQHRARLAASAAERCTAQGSYAEREKYACHAPEQHGAPPAASNGKVSEYLLLKQLRIEFPTACVSHELEFIDLPGLGVQKESDELLTREFLGELHGAFMFVVARQVQEGSVGKLAKRLSSDYRGNLRGRVWMVVTHFDAIDSRDAFSREQTLFDTIGRVLKDHGLAADSCLFLANLFYQELLAKGRTAGIDGPERATQEERTAKLQAAFDAGGKVVLPASSDRHIELASAYRRYVVDGGVQALRDVILQSVAASVRREVRAQSRATLGKVLRTLDRELELAQSRVGMSPAELRFASTWANKLRAAVEGLRYNCEDIEGPMTDVVDSMLESFDVDEHPAPNRRDFAEVHRTYLQLIDATAQVELDRRQEEVFHHVTDLLERSRPAPAPGPPGGPGGPGSLPPQLSPDFPDPRLRWNEVVENLLRPNRTRDGADFRRGTIEGLRRDPLAIEEGFDWQEYVTFMRAKIRCVVHNFTACLVEETASHLDQARQRLQQLGSQAELNDREGKETYQVFRTRAAQLLTAFPVDVEPAR